MPLLIILTVFLIIMFLYIWLFVLIHGSALSLSSLAHKLFKENPELLATLFTVGYLKTSFTSFIKHVRQLIWKKPRAKLGMAYIDGDLFTLSNIADDCSSLPKKRNNWAIQYCVSAMSA